MHTRRDFSYQNGKIFAAWVPAWDWWGSRNYKVSSSSHKVIKIHFLFRTTISDKASELVAVHASFFTDEMIREFFHKIVWIYVTFIEGQNSFLGSPILFRSPLIAVTSPNHSKYHLGKLNWQPRNNLLWWTQKFCLYVTERRVELFSVISNIFLYSRIYIYNELSPKMIR